MNLEAKKNKLKRIRSRARNLGHNVVADNISIDLASLSKNIDQKLEYLADVKSRREREYNYIRATIQRVETLLDANRISDISELDQSDLWKSYQVTYSQNIVGIFNWCHRVLWRYLDTTEQREPLSRIFMFSSFVWRLAGDKKTETTYLSKVMAKAKSLFSANAVLVAYCQTRTSALSDK